MSSDTTNGNEGNGYGQGHREVRKTDKTEFPSTLEILLNWALKVTSQTALVIVALWLTIKTIPEMAKENREGVVKAAESAEKVASEVGSKFDAQGKVLVDIRDGIHDISRTNKALYQMTKAKEGKPTEELPQPTPEITRSGGGKVDGSR